MELFRGSAHINAAMAQLARKTADGASLGSGHSAVSASNGGSISGSERAHSPFPGSPLPFASNDAPSEQHTDSCSNQMEEDEYDMPMQVHADLNEEHDEYISDGSSDDSDDAQGDDEALYIEEGDEEELADTEDDLSSDPPLQRSEGEWDRIEEEIRSMEEGVEGISQYEVIDKLGEGTFSSVYKAIDKNHYLYDNYLWTGKVQGPPPLSASPSHRSKGVYVALKRIYVTSSPQRILNELEIMEDLRNCRNISFLITAFRTEDQIIAVMPYSRHSDFREYYRIMPLSDLKCYFQCLFSALEGAHAANIIHRDVKPANFLYDPRTGNGTLCDFGLAERFEPHSWRGRCHHTLPSADHPFGRVQVNKSVASSHFEAGGALHDSSKSAMASVRSSKAMGPPERIGVLKEDTRQTIRANRAGTRGFRAPEVLYKCQDQTTALDIWSAGIILLAFLTKRFPLFNSNDDTEALLELTIIFGRRRMTQAAILHNRTFSCNLPTERTDGWRISEFIVRLNPDILKPPSNHPHPDRYVEEIERAMDLCRLCLRCDLTKRCSASQALKHPFLFDQDTESTSELTDTWNVQ